jgi:uncharacterized protein (TIGR03437 family)
MTRFQWRLVVPIIAGIVPICVFGHSYGPPPRVTAAPGDNAKACTQCHSSSPLNSGTGSVKILLQSGPVYIPGVKQRVAVQVSDPNQKRWGFELSARLDSDPANGQAGDFTPVDNMTQVICTDNAPKPCVAAGPIFITHTSAGTRNGTPGGATFEFDWTPPAADAGTVTFYVAGNAANGDAAFTGDLIYTSSLQLTPAIPVAPTVTAGNVVSSATYAAGPVSPNSWVTVYGSNLGVTTRSWADGDILNGGIPFSLDGVSVVLTLFGAPRLAYVGYVSPTQVNFLLPSDLAATATTVMVRNPAGASTPVPITVQANAAQCFTLDGKNVWALHANGSFVGKVGLLPSLTTAPAAPGETVTVYGTGMGPTTPALIPGQLPTAAASLNTLPKVTIGGNDATVVSAGVVPGAAGMYQLNIQVPPNAPDGDQTLVVQVGTASTASTNITVQKQ